MSTPRRTATVADSIGDWFDSQRDQYATIGEPGLGYERHIIDTIGPHAIVDCLLWRDETGLLLGILNHYPNDIPPYERAGSVTAWVSPHHQRRGIGTRLLTEAMKRWTIDLDQQQYTAAGLALVRHVERGGGFVVP